MAETVNIGEVAPKVSKDIFERFGWTIHPKRDDNFPCVSEEHLTEKGKPKSTHPGDAVFHYEDPYLGRRVYFHTDFKSYSKKAISSTKLRDAFKSLCMTVECAQNSPDWRIKYSVDSSEPHEVRGMLLVYNHDGKYRASFQEAVERVDLSKLPVAANSMVHFLGPHDVQRLYSIANDLMRLRHDNDLPADYTFYYPDLVLVRRQGDVWGRPATIESLTGPYFTIKHGECENHPKGYVIYYNRPGNSAEEFEYVLDSFSRFQMLESDETIRIRIAHDQPHEDYKSILHTAKKKYAKAWGFDPIRESILERIEIERITAVSSNYSPGDLGWRS